MVEDKKANSIKNLKPLSNNVRSRKLQVKGGKSKSVAKGMNARKNCNGKCKMYPCWAEPLSKSKYKGKCALKEFPKKIQERTLDFYTRGQDGFNRQLVELLTELGSDVQVSQNMNERRKYIRDVIEVRKSIYGAKTILEGEMKTENKNTISIDDLKEAYKQTKEKQKKKR